MKLIIGHTGLIGKTITEKEHFDYYFNTQNIHTFKSLAKEGDELFLSCLPATKWIVNKNLKEDINNIYNIINIISGIKFSKITLISTIDIYNNSPLRSDETISPTINSLNYGSNRYLFELMVKNLINYNDLKIFRLPALFNKHIKKNILFDLINNNINNININSSYQWYNLDNLTLDIKHYSEKYPEETIINLFTEPINTKEIISLFPQYNNLVNYSEPILYDYYTKFGKYIENKYIVLEQIKQFINGSGIK